jgi:DNA-binding CsgD family transcriptional regulator
MNDEMLPETLLADIYQSALLQDTSRFQQQVLARLQSAIGFDRAWWGLMRRETNGFRLLSSLRFELPEAFEADWQSVSCDDALASHVHHQPRTTIHFNKQALLSTPGLATLNSAYDLRQALCTSVFLPDKHSFLFVSLFRSGSRAPSFNRREVVFKQCITPHLYAGWRTNLIADVERSCWGSNIEDRAVAFVDYGGHLVCANQHFSDLMAQAFPAWRGGRKIPLALLNNSVLRISGYEIEQMAAGGLIRLEIRQTSPLQGLTPRELEIAIHYAQGQSYKQIALTLDLTPDTVRYYIQQIYEKLNIHEKTALVQRVVKHLSLPGYDSSNASVFARSEIVDYLS